MKKLYKKPLISVEVMSLDRPIADGCNMNPDTLEGLLAVGLFTEKKACLGGWVGTDGKMDMDMDHNWDITDDTICYHSNVQIAFKS